LEGAPDVYPKVVVSADPMSAIVLGRRTTNPAWVIVTAGIALSSPAGPPTSAVLVSGTGFGAGEGVDVLFDTTDAALIAADNIGNFGPIPVTIPVSASPGSHWISAEGRQSMLFAQAVFTVATTWPQFRDQPSHHGHNGTENVLSPLTVPGMNLAWSFTTGSSVFSSPAVADGMVYIGSGDGNVYALSVSTGAKLWSFSAGIFVLSSPAVANGVVYVGAVDANVYALSASTGAKLWSFLPSGVVPSSPAVANGVVYVGCADANVYALSASTGAELWSFHTSGVVCSSPAVANGVVYIGSFDGNVYALGLANEDM
jgi:outer membrane protein assembly factor BamB